MTAASVESCEGGCGCRVRYWRDRAWEVIDADDQRPTPRVMGNEPHTAQRCRVIRTLREAGETAAGPGGYAVIAVRPDGLVVSAFDGHGRWAQQQIGWHLALGVAPSTLRSLADHTAEHLRRALKSAVTTGVPREVMGVLARNPADWPRRTVSESDGAS